MWRLRTNELPNLWGHAHSRVSYKKRGDKSAERTLAAARIRTHDEVESDRS
jgi:hypothetical protein